MAQRLVNLVKTVCARYWAVKGAAFEKTYRLTNERAASALPHSRKTASSLAAHSVERKRNCRASGRSARLRNKVDGIGAIDNGHIPVGREHFVYGVGTVHRVERTHAIVRAICITVRQTLDSGAVQHPRKPARSWIAGIKQRPAMK